MTWRVLLRKCDACYCRRQPIVNGSRKASFETRLTACMFFIPDFNVCKDFWGPLCLATVYSLLIVWGQFRVIPWILMLWVVGSGLLFVLARSFGGNSHGLAYICAVVGYGILPLILATVTNLLCSAIIPQITIPIKVTGVLWSTGVATVLICHSELAEKKAMVGYPTALVYYFLASLQSGV